MIKNLSRVKDLVKTLAGFNRQTEDRMTYRGHVRVILTGPDGKIKQIEEIHNLVTSNGDNVFTAANAVGGTAQTTYAMKMGTATTTPSKTGAGSFVAVGDYVTGSAEACDGGTPTAAANVLTFTRTYAGGQGTSTTLNRISIVTNTTNAGEANANGTLAIALFANTIPKGASDTLAITWTITFLGA
jgi:hypothetical protein